MRIDPDDEQRETWLAESDRLRVIGTAGPLQIAEAEKQKARQRIASSAPADCWRDLARRLRELDR